MMWESAMNVPWVLLSISMFPPDAPNLSCNDSLLIIERVPGMHQVVEDEDYLPFSQEDFLRAFRMSEE
jgi:hypothetical protein